MKTIHKFNVALTEISTVAMPEGAQLLSTQMQHGNISVWAKVDSNARMRNVKFCVIDTGQPFPDGEWKFLGTVQTATGLVYHILYEASI